MITLPPSPPLTSSRTIIIATDPELISAGHIDHQEEVLFRTSSDGQEWSKPAIAQAHNGRLDLLSGPHLKATHNPAVREP